MTEKGLNNLYAVVQSEHEILWSYIRRFNCEKITISFLFRGDPNLSVLQGAGCRGVLGSTKNWLGTLAKPWGCTERMGLQIKWKEDKAHHQTLKESKNTSKKDQWEDSMNYDPKKDIRDNRGMRVEPCPWSRKAPLPKKWDIDYILNIEPFKVVQVFKGMGNKISCPQRCKKGPNTKINLDTVSSMTILGIPPMNLSHYAMRSWTYWGGAPRGLPLRQREKCLAKWQIWRESHQK